MEKATGPEPPSLRDEKQHAAAETSEKIKT